MSNTQILPVEVTSKADVARLKHEIDELSELFHQQKLTGTATEKIKVSPLLEDVLKNYAVDLQDTAARADFVQKLSDILTSSPVFHISFATTPSAEFLEKITQWFRTEIHPSALLQVGLQPGIAAGCIVRTPNRQFDFSLRQFLQAKQNLLLQGVRGDA